MKNPAAVPLTFTLLAFTAALLLLPQIAATQSQQAMPGMNPDANSTEPVPAFHAQPPTGQLPPTMDPAMFSDKQTFNAYLLAGRVRKVLYQQPCYCHCDRAHGHGSLLDCFVGRHGSGCNICMKEAFYSYEQTHKGKAPAQIREAIIRGEWDKIDLAKYQKEYLPAR